jgi:serine phosphatase RsbU (regulator of sigma subunit)
MQRFMQKEGVIKPADLPAPSGSALRVIEACTNQANDANRLGQLVSQDPLLAVELLRIVNSAYFGFNREISSLARAITIIGQQGLRSLALCIAMRDAMKAEDLPTLPIDEFWISAIRRAVCARELAKITKQNEETCFTAGLIQDFGLLALFYLHKNRISEWPNLTDALPDERYDMERQLFGETHDKLGLQVAQTWGLPDELAVAIGYHHDPASERLSTSEKMLCQVSHCADWMASIYSTKQIRKAMSACQTLLHEHFEISEERMQDLLSTVGQQISQTAEAFGIPAGDPKDFESIMRDANLRLAEENLSYQELTWKLQHALAEQDRVAEELQKELELAREVQRSLLPNAADEQHGIVGVNVSAKAVSGDFYDYFKLRDGKIAFCIADVSGKGMNAALLMAKTSSLFRCLAKGLHDPAKLMWMLNREIFETSIRGMFVTMVAGVFNPVSKLILLANAGHLPVIELAGRQLINEYPSLSPPLGIVPDARFQNSQVELADHTLYLYTDGLLEARIDQQTRLEREGLLDLLQKYTDKNATERLQYIVSDIRKRSQGFDDDLTLLLVEG